MAELLAILGGAAAFTQLLHYGCASIGTTSAFFCSIRHAADEIDTWMHHSSLMIKILDDIENALVNHGSNAIQMLDRCRMDVAKLQSLLRQFRRSEPARRRTKISESLFVVLRKEEIEHIMSSFQNNFGILTSYCTVVAVSQGEFNPKMNIQPEPQVPRSCHQDMRSVIYTLNVAFGANFTRVQKLHRGHALNVHVSTILDTTMQYPADEDVCMEAAALAVRLCMYLLTTGQYLRVLNVLAIFKTWSATILPACFEAMTALSGKEAVAHALNGNISTAFRSFRRLHRSRTKTLGTSDLCTLHTLNGLGLIHHAMGNVREAVQHHKSCFQSKSGLLGPEDPDTLVSANNLGIALLSQGNNDAAKQLFDKSLTSWSQAYGADDLFVITARSNQGIALHFQGKLDEAEHSHRYVYKKRHRILGPHHHETVKSQANLAITLNERGHHAEAEALYREALTIFQAKLGEMHPDTLKTHTNLATALHDQGKFRQAEIVVASAVPLMQKKLGATHVETLGALEFRAILLQHLGKFLKAHSLATELYEVREKKLGFYHDDTQRSLQHVRDLAEDVEEAHVMRRFPSALPVAIC